MNSPIELRHLGYLVCLADELHFGRAAERLGLAQAALSQQIRQLEERIGVRLFERTTRRVKLTPAGAVMLGHARELLGGVEQAVAHTRAIHGGETGRLIVGGVHVAVARFLPRVIRVFRQHHPAVTVDVVPLGTADQLAMLESGGINVAFIRPTTHPAFIRMKTLAAEGFVAVLPKGHRLAAFPRLTLEQCADEPMVGYAPTIGAAYRSLVLGELKKLGKQPILVQQTSRTLSVATLVASGTGIGIVPAWIRHVAVAGVVYRRITDLPKAVELAVAWPTGETSPLVHDFVALAQAGSRARPRAAVRG